MTAVTVTVTGLCGGLAMSHYTLRKTGLKERQSKLKAVRVMLLMTYLVQYRPFINHLIHIALKTGKNCPKRQALV